MGASRIVFPKDVERSGHRDCDCYAQYYGETESEVMNKARGYFARYPKEGYGTYFMVPIQKHSDSYWYCKLSRYHSCD
jgi:hypothetical protein